MIAGNLLVSGHPEMTSLPFLVSAIDNFISKQQLSVAQLIVSRGSKTVECLAENWAIQHLISVQNFIPQKRYGISCLEVNFQKMVRATDLILFLTPTRQNPKHSILEFAAKFSRPVYFHYYLKLGSEFKIGDSSCCC